MTNAEKYLKDGVNLEEFSKSIMTWYFGNYAKANDFARIKNWAERKIETLTEDEKVILRNIKDGYKYIYKTTEGHLMLSNIPFGTKATYVSTRNISQYKHLFQFIKEGEEYSIEELLKGE